MWKLVIEDDEGKRTVVPLTRDDYTIGRKEGNTIRLTERNVSRDHAKLHKANGAGAPRDTAGANGGLPGYVLEDLTSYNGVYVNGMRVAQAQELVHGDLIQIGDYRIVLQDDQAVEEEPVPMDSEDLKATIPSASLPSPLRATNAAVLDKPNRLIMLAGPTPGEEYPLVDDRLTIGRAEEATISVNHNSVSRLHCEVHALGEGRFEIVDKGSSNGVRVNGADLRRGIIEAGDVIELGDVKFKFVGQGQLFRPGSSDSQQLAAISNRTAMVATGQGRSSVVPAILLGALVAIGLVAAWAYMGKKPVEAPTQPTASVSAPENADSATLAEAKRVCDSGDYEGAHQKIAQLPDPSPVRSSADFKFIEYSWATNILLHADTEGDAVAKRALLERVAGAASVDPGLRKTANDRLAAMDQPPAVASGARDAGKAPLAGSSSRTGATRTTQAQVSLPDPTVPLPPNPTRPVQRLPPSASLFETERNLALSSNPDDLQRARAMLEPRVFGHKGTASADEVRLLKSICKNQHDTVCVQHCADNENGN
jgi:pSer/pThr/pTyr-binding forkhead associated (FHA) protein